jgi:dihydrofolate reductase
MLKLALIFAVAENGVIGRRGGLPWDYPEDREHFHATTRGHAVIMGRRTWEETGAALPDRTNIVVSRAFVPPRGVLHATCLDDALRIAWTKDDEPFVIGGARLFEEALPLATRAYVTLVPGAPDGDTFLRFDPKGMRVTSSRSSPSGLRFLVYERER